MTFEETRQAIFTAVAGMTTSLYTSDRVVYPNQPDIDFSTKPHRPFLLVDTEYVKTEQIALGVNPPARYWGMLTLSLYVVAGSGSKSHSEFYDLVVTNFQTKNISGIVFKVPKPTKIVTTKEWNYSSVMVPFYFEKLT